MNLNVEGATASLVDLRVYDACQLADESKKTHVNETLLFKLFV